MFDKPIEVDGASMAFGGDMEKLMPTYEQIPDEFKQSGGEWQDFQAKWFFSGLKDKDMPTPKEGIDLIKALRHLQAIQASWEPQHEHKCAAVAYLASKWFVSKEKQAA